MNWRPCHWGSCAVHFSRDFCIAMPWGKMRNIVDKQVRTIRQEIFTLNLSCYDFSYAVEKYSFNLLTFLLHLKRKGQREFEERKIRVGEIIYWFSRVHSSHLFVWYSVKCISDFQRVIYWYPDFVRTCQSIKIQRILHSTSYELVNLGRRHKALNSWNNLVILYLETLNDRQLPFHRWREN